jgi:SLT domain-containing protein
MGNQNPYEPAVEWIQRHNGTGSAAGLAKLILSLWNDDAAFSFRECTRNLDDIRSALALNIIKHFLGHGEDLFLVDAGKQVYGLYPHLWEKGYAGSEGKREWERQREREREERNRKEHPEWFEKEGG